MLPHAKDEVEELSLHGAINELTDANGWKVQEWHLTSDDVDRTVAAYQALLRGDLDDELEAMLAEVGINPLGPPISSDQHAKVARADAIELVAAATVLAIEEVGIDDIWMPNVPKMSAEKSDSGIDVIGIELDPNASGEPGEGERLVIVSVKHTVEKYASGMRGLLEKSVGEDLSGPYLYRQLTTLNGRLRQAGVAPEVARRVIYFIRQTLSHPSVRIVCVAASAPVPHCNLPSQPSQLGEATGPDMHFRMLFVPDIDSLHTKLIPND